VVAAEPSGSRLTTHSQEPTPELAGGWSRRDLALAWHLPLLAGLLPILLGGFAASALANRTAFAGWAVGCGAVYTVALRVGLGRGWDRRLRAAVLLAVLAVSFAAFAGLVDRHQEILDLGYRAVLWSLYAPAVTDPPTYGVLAGVLALAAVWQLTAWRTVERRRRLGSGPGAGSAEGAAGGTS
jgi:hypothetical protein